jgi:hypothetical protein
LKRRWVIGLSALLTAVWLPASATCWQEAAAYGVSPDLIKAVARVESSLDPSAVNRSHFHRTNSINIGLTQVNSRWLKTLSQWGITEQSLMDGCTNVKAGAWILSQTFKQHGNTWDAVGAFNAACTQLKGNDCFQARAKYAWKVYRALLKDVGAVPDQLIVTPVEVAQPVNRVSRLARLEQPAVISSNNKTTYQTQVTASADVDSPNKESDDD